MKFTAPKKWRWHPEEILRNVPHAQSFLRWFIKNSSTTLRCFRSFLAWIRWKIITTTYIHSAIRTGQEKPARQKYKDRLESIIGWCDLAESFFVASVLIGLTGEEVFSSKIHPMLHPICTWSVIAGVAGEFFSHILQSGRSKRLVALQKQELEEISLETAKANERAEKAILELKKYKSWRYINKEQQRKFSKDLLLGTVIQDLDIWVSPITTEAQWFCGWLAAVIRDACWHVDTFEVDFPAVNVSIELHPQAEEKTRAAADKLVRLLEENGIPVTNEPPWGIWSGACPPSEPNILPFHTPAPIRMIIGEKTV